mmetsp:Transcript_65433/g.80106  ORF Transcript_65433/g.80106 Transcript_65433/m.80106 type:complete len:170 (+) Transcript_65433:102-611(+)
MKVTLLVVLLVGISNAARNVSVTVHNCTVPGDEGHVDSLTVNPVNIVVGENFTITGQGSVVSNNDINNGIYNVSCVDANNNFQVFQASGSVCEDNHVQFPANAGEFWFKGVNCPIKSGQYLVVVVTIQLHLDMPGGTFDVFISINDEDTQKEIICVNGTMIVEPIRDIV